MEVFLMDKIELEMVYDRNSKIEVQYFSDNTIEIQCAFEMEFLQLDGEAVHLLLFFLKRNMAQLAADKRVGNRFGSSEKYLRHLRGISMQIDRLIKDDGFRVELSASGKEVYVHKDGEYLAIPIDSHAQPFIPIDSHAQQPEE